MVDAGDRRGVAGTASLPLLVFLCAAPVAAVVFLVSVGLQDGWTDAVDPIGLTVLVSMYGSFCLLVATAGIRVGDGLVRVVGAVTITSIPVGRVQTVHWDDGVTVLSDDGLQAGTIALGGSLGAQLTGNRRQLAAATRLIIWVQAHASGADDSASAVRWRGSAFAACACWTATAATLILTSAFA